MKRKGSLGKKRKSGYGTLLGTNISPPKGTFEDDFPFPKLVPWRVISFGACWAWATSNLKFESVIPWGSFCRPLKEWVHQRPLFWAIYNDLSQGHPKWWFSRGIPPKWP